MPSDSRAQMIRSFQQRNRKRKPPHIYAPAVVPGYGDYIKTKAAKKVAQLQARGDRNVHSNTQQNYGPPMSARPRRRRNRPTRATGHGFGQPTLN